MRFYRPTTEADFTKGYEVKIDHFYYLTRELKSLVESGQRVKAIKALRGTTGMGIDECKKYVDKYANYLEAKEDFYAGKPVFTEY